MVNKGGQLVAQVPEQLLVLAVSLVNIYRVIPLESTRKDPKAALWPTFTAVPPPVTGTTGALVAVGTITGAGTTGAIVGAGGIGVADAQADRTKARIVKLKNNVLVFI